MKIFLHQNPALFLLEQYFDFNKINYEKIDLRVQEQYTLNLQELQNENTLLVMQHEVFLNILEYSKKELLNFCNNNNFIWVFKMIDGMQTIK